MNICSACHQENPMDARFCGFCGFRMAPIGSQDWKSLASELQPIDVESPVMLSEVSKVKGKGAQHLAGVGDTPSLHVPQGKESVGPRVVGKWEEPPVRVFPKRQGAGAKGTSKGREPGDSGIVANVPTPTPTPPPPAPPAQVVRPTPAPPAQVVQPTPAPRPTPPVQAAPPPPAQPPAQTHRPSTPPPVASPQAADLPDGRTARRYRRFPLKVEVGYATDHNFYTGFIENLSSGGLFIATHQPTQIGEVMEVTFTVPGIPAPCIAIAQVTWLRDYDASNEDMVPGMGLKFIQLDPKVRAAVELFIKHREPIFFD